MSTTSPPRDVEEQSVGLHPRFWRKRSVRVGGGLLLVVLLGLSLAAEYMVRHAAPILRERMIQTLSQTFNSPVELDALDISLVKGIEVQGHGLRIPFGTAPQGANTSKNLKPLVSVADFRFRTGWRGVLRPTAEIDMVRVDGVEVHIPPKAQRPLILGTREGKLPADPARPKIRPRTVFLVHEVEATNAKLFIETDKPGKEPLEFDIGHIRLEGGSSSTPWQYTANLVNPKPAGDITATGNIGPWNGDDPRQTHVDGNYSFQHADLNTIKGIGGHLSSIGHLNGPLELIAVEGDTDTPDFSIDTSNHPVPLHTHFKAHVDGTDGDTYLDQVNARLLHSDFVTRGKVVKIDGQGHDIALDVTMDRARIEDMLLMGVKTRPPLMSGQLAMQAKLHIPPGPERVIQKLDLRGKFGIRGVRFSNPAFQDRVDRLSARAQGKPEEVALASRDHEAEVRSQMSARFTLICGLLTAEDVHYEMPGATVLLHGVYSTDGNVFEFKGHVRTEAHASQMVSGWRRWLLKPIDPFLAKHGAGVELPVQISGTQGDMHFGLALKDSDESSAEMVKDLKEKRSELREEAKAKREGRSGRGRPEQTAASNVELEREQRRQIFASGNGTKPSPDSTGTPRLPQR